MWAAAQAPHRLDPLTAADNSSDVPARTMNPNSSPLNCASKQQHPLGADALSEARGSTARSVPAPLPCPSRGLLAPTSGTARLQGGSPDPSAPRPAPPHPPAHGRAHRAGQAAGARRGQGSSPAAVPVLRGALRAVHLLWYSSRALRVCI